MSEFNFTKLSLIALVFFCFSVFLTTMNDTFVQKKMSSVYRPKNCYSNTHSKQNTNNIPFMTQTILDCLQKHNADLTFIFVFVFATLLFRGYCSREI